ncbi:MAG: phosphoglycerate dehydrogenase [Candidatus Omnitrophica bacterium]|nr:phosphoglycerate dehydrogenase [Candidatus Omnitrophota bacterium]
MKPRVVYIALQQFCEQEGHARETLEEAGFQILQNQLGRRLQREEMPEILKEADAVLAGVEPYDAQLIAALPKLKCISRCGVGTESVDLEAARLHRIAVLTTPEEVVEPVAQMTIGMILALARNFPQHLSDARQGLWKKRVGFLLSEWTIGMVGFGRIGRAVERILRIFGPKIRVTDPKADPRSLPPGVETRELSALLAESDLVSLHASRRPEEGPLLGERELHQMRQGSYLVNTARGSLVDEAALVRALASGHLAAAALDVFQTEPAQSSPLFQMPQVLCTPHVGSLTRASRAAMELKCAKNVVEFFNGSA